jgi:hypothetical protein
LTTELKGVTPKKHVMTAHWWYQTLRNPKHAGYQWPSKYEGYKPGIESKRREQQRGESELVPCLLPALWTLDDWREVLATASKRWRAPKLPRAYHAYLTHSLLYGADCGHRLAVCARKEDGRFWVRCYLLEPGQIRHGNMTRADVVEAELDELIGRLSLRDDGLTELIEEELREISRREGVERARFRADPVIGSVRQALATLQSAGIADGREPLERKLKALEAADEQRKDSLSGPVTTFQAARRQLERWAEVWAGADKREKNKLLIEAGLRIDIARRPDERQKGAPAHVVRISVSNPAFAFALAAAITPANRFEVAQPSGETPSPRFVIELPSEFEEMLFRLSRHGRAGEHWTIPLASIVPIPDKIKRPKPPRPSGDWLTVGEAARAIGCRPESITEWIRRGWVSARRSGNPVNPWLFVEAHEVERLKRSTPGLAAPAMVAWLRERMAKRERSDAEIAQRAGVRPMTVGQARRGVTSPSKDVAIRLAGALLAIEPDAHGEALLAAELQSRVPGRWDSTLEQAA